MGKKILIADDDVAITESLEALLESEGYSVTRTSDSSTVRNLRTAPDLLLLDVWMSGQDGISLCKHLKGQKQTKHMPIIVMSANKESELLAKEAGADAFIAKPFDNAVLLKKVKAFLA